MIITIAREYGSGGRIIGQKVAEKLGFTFYDNELIRKACRENGMDFDFVAEQSEYAGNKFFQNILMSDPAIGSAHAATALSLQDKIFVQIGRIVKEIARTENAVIVGRSADSILRERENVLNVFIHADPEHKLQRVLSLGIPEKEARKTMKRRDKMRANFHKYYTGEDWGTASSYALTLDSGALGYDLCVDLICQAAQHKTQNLATRNKKDEIEKASSILRMFISEQEQ